MSAFGYDPPADLSAYLKIADLPAGSVVQQLSGTAGGVGTYQVSVSQTVASGTITGTGFVPATGANVGIYVSAANIVAAVIADLKAYFKQINDTGARIFYVWERGAANFSAALIGYMRDINILLRDYIQLGDDYRGAPNIVVLDPTSKTVVTSNAAAVALKNSADGVHDNVTASQILGLYFANVIAPYLREIPGHRLGTLTQGNGFGARSLNPNPGMSGSVAAGGAGNTGNIPTNFISQQTGTATAVFTVQATAADADGNTFGNETKIVASGGASGGTIVLYLSLDQTKITQNSLVKVPLEYDVAAGAVGLVGVAVNSESFPTTGGPTPQIDMFGTGIGLDPGGYTGFVSEPDALALGAFTGIPYTNQRMEIKLNANGSATITTRKWLAELSPLTP